MDEQARQDAEHLRLLSIFHYVVAGLAALWATFPIFHLIFGAVILFGPFAQEKPGEPLPRFVGAFFMAFAAVWMAIGWTLAVCILVAGRRIARRSSYMFCLVVAGIMAAICMPFGTVLGVFTIVVLMRPSVKRAFEAA